MSSFKLLGRSSREDDGHREHAKISVGEGLISFSEIKKMFGVRSFLNAM